MKPGARAARRRSAPLDLDIVLLRALVAVNDHGSVTRAGLRLGRTQPAVSLQLKRLEEQAGRPLFLRRGGRLGLTQAGEMVLAHARAMLKLNDDVRTRLVDDEVDGLVRLGTPEDFATSRLPSVLARFAASHPRVDLEVQCDFTANLLERFASGGFDIVLAKREPGSRGGGHRVWHEPLVWAAARGFRLAADAPVPLVAAPVPDVYRKRALEALAEAGRRARVAYTSPSLAGIRAAVLAGLGAAVLPRGMVSRGMRVMHSSEGLPALRATEIVLLRSANLPPAAAQLAEHIIDSLEKGARLRPISRT